MSAAIANELGSREAAINLLRNNVNIDWYFIFFLNDSIKCKNLRLGSWYRYQTYAFKHFILLFIGLFDSNVYRKSDADGTLAKRRITNCRPNSAFS